MKIQVDFEKNYRHDWFESAVKWRKILPTIEKIQINCLINQNVQMRQCTEENNGI